MVLFKTIRWKNFLSTGDAFTEVSLNRSPSTLIVGENGAGKCVDKLTEIEVEFESEEIKQLYLKHLS
jgi:predicted ATPase